MMKLTKIHQTRLLRIANKLLGEGPYAKVGPVPKRKFNLRKFFMGTINPDECGFVACAVGHAATDPWFNRQGLSTETMSSGLFWFGDVNFEGRYAWEDLFAVASYRFRSSTRPGTVARRIRWFVEDNR